MIHVHNHHAMATIFQVRIAGEETAYAAQAARAMFDEADRLENLLSRFRASSDISAMTRLEPGESLRLSEPTLPALRLQNKWNSPLKALFSVTAAAKRTQSEPPRWHLDPEKLTITCESGKLELDLGAIGKGFALDRMAVELADWECPAFLLIAGGSSILAGDPPPDSPGWSIGLGEDNSEPRYWLKHGSLSGSGIAVKGHHIYDPQTGQPASNVLAPGPPRRAPPSPTPSPRLSWCMRNPPSPGSCAAVTPGRPSSRTTPAGASSAAGNPGGRHHPTAKK